MSTNYIVWKYFQDALATDDSIEAGAKEDVGSDHDYEPEIETGVPHPIDFDEALQFAERMHQSDFVVSMFTNLIAKAYGVKDPNLLTTPTGIRNMRSRLRRTCMEEHKKKIKYLFAIKVFTLMELKTRNFQTKITKFDNICTFFWLKSNDPSFY